MFQKWAPIVLVIVAVLIGVVIRLSPDQKIDYHGVVYEDPKIAPQIKLSSGDGEFNLADQKGKVVLLFFGYTSCPDICPSTLSDMKRVLNTLGEDADRVQVIFITVDPERDTNDKLGEYVSIFNPDFVGLSGSESELSPIWDSYGVIREIDDSSKSLAGYLVNHTSRLYLIDPLGRLFITYGFGTPIEDISDDIKNILNEYPNQG